MKIRNVDKKIKKEQFKRFHQRYLAKEHINIQKVGKICSIIKLF